MALYQYRATNTSGQVFKGQIEAAHELDLESQLKRMNLMLVRAKTVRQRRGGLGSIPGREVIGFLFQMEMLVRAGVPILAILNDLREGSESAAGRDLASGLYEKIEGGSTLAEAMNHYQGIFSETVINLVRAGEVSGQLPQVLAEIVRTLKWEDELKAQTKKLLMYPSFVIVVITGVVFFLKIYLVPQMVSFLSQMGQEIPFQTRLLINVSKIFVDFWWAILLTPPLLIAAVAAMSAANPQVRYSLHRAVLSVPLVGPVLKKMILARFADTLALMYRTGIPLIDGLSYCQKITSNVVIRQGIWQARERVLNGEKLSDGFASEQLFPSLVIRMLRVGESTGGLDKALDNVSYFYTRDIDESVAKIQSMIEPILTVAMGLVLGWIMMAVLSPIYDTITKMKT